MKAIYLHLLTLLLPFCLNAQTPDLSISEDYSNPKSYSWKYTWKPTDEYRTGKIENGIYVSKAKSDHASLGFPYALNELQKDMKIYSDMEFDIIKLKGEIASPITISLQVAVGSTMSKLKFTYNGTGDWSAYGDNADKKYSTGKVVVKAGSNQVRIVHRMGSVKFYFNNEFLLEQELGYQVSISWWPISIFSPDNDVILGLDKTVFKGYDYLTVLMDKKTKDAEEEKKKRESNFLVTETFPNGKKTYTGTAISISFDYNANWNLKDFENKSFLGKTGIELTVSKSETGGYFLVTTDTTSLSYDAYFKKNVDVNYFNNGVQHSNVKLIDAEPIINGQKAKMREVFYSDDASSETNELWCLIIKDKRYYILYSVFYPADRASVLSSFNSFKIE